MNNKFGRVLIAVLGLAAIVYGIKQFTGGLQQMTGNHTLTMAEARQVAQAAAGNLTPFVSESRGISLGYPKGWDAEEFPEGPMFFKFYTLSGVVNVNIATEDLPEDTALEAYAQLNVDQTESILREQNVSFGVLSRSEIEIGQLPAIQLLFSYVPPDANPDLKLTQVFAISGDRAYAITLTTLSDVHGAFDDLFEEILASVEFL